MKVYASSYQRLNALRGRLGPQTGAALEPGALALPELENRLRLLCPALEPALPELACRLLMRRAVDRTLSRDPAYHPSCSTPGFADYLLSLYRRLALSGSARPALPAPLARTLETYRTLARGLDRADLRAEFLRRLSRLNLSILGPLAEISFVGAGPLPDFERALFAALLRLGARVEISLAVPDRPDCREALVPADGCGFPVRFLAEHPVPSVGAVLGFAGAGERPDFSAVSLLRASGPYREIEQVFRLIRRALDAGGPDLNPFDFAVLLPDLESVYQYVEDVAKRYSVPVHIRRGTPLLGVPFTAQMLGFLGWIIDGFPSSEACDLAGAPCWNSLFPGTDPAGRRRALLDYVARNNAAGSLPAWGAFGEPWFSVWLSWAKKLSGLTTFSAFCAQLSGLIGVVLPADDWPLSDVKAREKLLFLLDSAVRAARRVPEADLSGSIADFNRLLVRELERAFVQYYSGVPTGVQALPLADAVGCAFRHVYILSLNDRVVPAPGRPDPVLTEAQREALGLPPAAAARQSGLAAFWGAVASARATLTLSYSDSSASGDELIPSYLYEDVRGLLGLDSVPGCGPEETLVRPLADCLGEEDFLRRAVFPATPEGERAACAAKLSDRARLLEIVARQSGYRLKTSAGGLFAAPGLACELAAKAASRSLFFSARAAAALLSCPLRWFFEHYLALPVHEPVCETLLPRVLGSARHLCLQNLTLRHPYSGRWAEVGSTELEAELRRAWKERRVVPLGRAEEDYRYEFHAEVEALARYFEAESAAESYQVADCETGFGAGNRKYGDLFVSLPDFAGGLFFHGVVDRLDLVPDAGLRIVDYKFSDMGLSRKLDVLYQLSVYFLLVSGARLDGASLPGGPLCAACHNLKSEGRDRVLSLADLLKSLDKNLSEGDWFSPEAPASFLNKFRSAVGELLLGKLRASSEGCPSCKLKTVCFYSDER